MDHHKYPRGGAAHHEAGVLRLKSDGVEILRAGIMVRLLDMVSRHCQSFCVVDISEHDGIETGTQSLQVIVHTISPF